MKASFLQFFLALAALTLFCHHGQAATIEGIALTPEGPLKNVQVFAYKTFTDLVQHKAAFSSVPSKKEGQYLLELPTGQFYLTAEGTTSKGPFFSYHGLNPVSITADYRWIPFFTIPQQKSSCAPGYQGIGGHVRFRGSPVANGGVSVYTVSDEPFRGMGLLTNTLTAKGEYWFDLEPGTYVIIGRQRSHQQGIGPLNQGDLFCYSAANPVTLRLGMECNLEIECYPRNDLEHFLSNDATDPRGKRQEMRRTASLQDTQALNTETLPNELPKQTATISGVVTDVNGSPKEGLIITAYAADDLDLFQMYILRFKTPYMATTDTHGAFTLDVQSGPYYLVAREKVGEAPVALEFYGLYEGTANHTIVVRPGEHRNDAHIIVGQVMP